jgi:CheY-like chemotaxis protein
LFAPVALLTGRRAMPRILLVEDDKDVRLLVEHVLIRERYEVDATATLQAGRRLLAGNRYDLLLTDAALPDGTGIELAHRAEERGIPVIVMTAYAFRFGDELLRFEVLLKPVRPAELSKAVGRALGLALP